MVYIICAFEAEGRALIDAYRLQKQQSIPYPLFSNDDVILLISGMGQENAKAAAEYLLSNHEINKDDCFVNLGICAAKKKYELGELLQVGTLQDEKKSYELSPLSSSTPSVSCFSACTPLDTTVQTEIAEMEAISIYKAVRSSFKPQRISFLKVVSDHFQPFVPKKQFVIQLVQKNIKDILTHITQLKGENSER